MTSGSQMEKPREFGAWYTKTGHPLRGDPSCFNVAATYFSTPVQSSIIGPPGLNGRVRDGNGCDPWGKATTKGRRVIEKGCEAH